MDMTQRGFEVKKYPDGEEHPYAIAFHRLNGAEKQPTADEILFTGEIEDALRRVSNLLSEGDPKFLGSDSFKDYYNRLFFAAQNGVEHGSGNLAIGRVSLESTKDYFVQMEGPRLRKRFLRKLHWAAFFYVFGAFCLLFVLEEQTKIVMIGIDWVPYFQALMVTTITLGFAAWLRRMLDHGANTWDTLKEFGTANYPISVRFTVLIGIAIMFMLLLGTGVVDFEFVSYSLQDYVDDTKIQALIGVSCGMAERRVTAVITNAFND